MTSILSPILQVTQHAAGWNLNRKKLQAAEDPLQLIDPPSGA